jgi:hypothetical protein
MKFDKLKRRNVYFFSEISGDEKSVFDIHDVAEL